MSDGHLYLPLQGNTVCTVRHLHTTAFAGTRNSKIHGFFFLLARKNNHIEVLPFSHVLLPGVSPGEQRAFLPLSSTVLHNILPPTPPSFVHTHTHTHTHRFQTMQQCQRSILQTLAHVFRDRVYYILIV